MVAGAGVSAYWRAMHEVAVITVAYNSEAVLPEMLRSVPEGTEVVIVDNGSRDAKALAKIAAGHKLIRNDVNEGFGRACNRGAQAANAKWLLFLNPDATLSEGAMDAFLASAQRHPSASAFNPRFLNRKGAQSFRRRSKLAPPETRFEGPVPEGDAEIPTLLGSAIFLSKARFDEVGGFDPAIFLYHEDDDLALRLQKLGPLMLCYGAVVMHQEGHGSARTPQTAALKAFHMARSRVYAYGKHGHASALRSTLLRGVAGLVSPLMLSRRKRAKHWGFFKGAISAIRDGGRYE